MNSFKRNVLQKKVFMLQMHKKESYYRAKGSVIIVFFNKHEFGMDRLRWWPCDRSL
jgi:hypothetical protein